MQGQWTAVVSYSFPLSRQGDFDTKHEPLLSRCTGHPSFPLVRVRHSGSFQEMENEGHQQARFMWFSLQGCTIGFVMVLDVTVVTLTYSAASHEGSHQGKYPLKDSARRTFLPFVEKCE